MSATTDRPNHWVVDVLLADRLANALRALLGPSANLSGTPVALLDEALAAIKAYEDATS